MFDNNQPQQQQDNSNISSNMGNTDFSALQLRLDTQNLHGKIYNFLRGTTSLERYDAQSGVIFMEEVIKGKPLANDEGIQNILSCVIAIANNHTVQGNTTIAQLNDFMHFFELQLGVEFMKNCDSWGIERRNRTHIFYTISNMFYLFLTRTLDNEERKTLVPIIQRDRTLIQTPANSGGLVFGGQR